MGRVKSHKKMPGNDPHHEMKGNGNRLFAKTDEKFQEACIAAGVQPTKRQASKYRRKMGAAWNYRP